MQAITLHAAVAGSCTVDGCNTNSVVCTINEVSNSHPSKGVFTDTVARRDTDVVTGCITITSR